MMTVHLMMVAPHYDCHRYRWEESERREVRTRLAGIEPVLAREAGVESKMKRWAQGLCERVDARRTERDYAAKREKELQMLELLSELIEGSYLDSRSALQPSLAPQTLAENDVGGSGGSGGGGGGSCGGGKQRSAAERLVARMKTAHRDATPTEEDLLSVGQIDEILQWQERLSP